MGAVLAVGGDGGRGFVVKIADTEPCELIITAAHCLPHLPPAHSDGPRTYQRLLGPLGGEPSVWAECLFADPIADIAVLGEPDNQVLHREADAYQKLTTGRQALTIADAPSLGSGLLLAPDGRQWLRVRVRRDHDCLSVDPPEVIAPGMSGSPIILPGGRAIGVVVISTSDALYGANPVLMRNLPARIIKALKTGS
jgi:hypothetical protein